MTEGQVSSQVEAGQRAPLLTGASAAPPAPEEHRLGLVQATALVMGSMIGVGIFSLPHSLATYGPITLISMVVTTIGAIALALLFGALSRRLPAGGGPYAYSRVAYGNAVGFVNAWSYWITAWAGTATIAVGWVLYVERFINKDDNRVAAVFLVLAGLWLPALVNLTGVKNMGIVQVVTTVVKFAALVFMSTVGLFFISSGNFTPWNVSHESWLGAVGGGMALALFSYLGVETASVAAGKVKDPYRNIPRATILGTIFTAIVYLLSLIAMFGILSDSALKASAQPYAAAMDTMFGGKAAGDIITVAVIISGLGALNGWMLICAEMPLAAANDGLFPARFKNISSRGVPAFGVVSSTVLASIAIILNYIGSSGDTVFTTLILMSGITAAVPYGFSALAQMKWRWVDHQALHTPRFVRDLVVAVVALLFSIGFCYYSRNTGQSTFVYWAPFLLAGAFLLLGVPIYIAQRPHMTQPEAVPPYRLPDLGLKAAGQSS